MDQVNAGGARNAAHHPAHREDRELVELFARTKTESGKSLLSVIDQGPVMLVFLRHFGCASCRETMADMAKAQAELRRRGVQPVFVHMGTPERARPFFDKFGLADVERVSDPKAEIYQAPVFHLLKSTVVPEFFSGSQILAYTKRALWRYGAGTPGKEDATQLPGVFFIKERRITKAFRHRGVADRPDYERFGV
jgi:peroxiredoxin